jgi:hypothetical protein
MKHGVNTRCVQALEALLQGVLQGTCKAVEEGLAAEHKGELRSKQWKAIHGALRIGCRSTVTDTATARWTRAEDVSMPSGARAECAYGYGVFAAACQVLNDLPESMCTRIEDVLAGRVKADTLEVSTMVSQEAIELMGTFILDALVSCFIHALPQGHTKETC